tara:strand:+ start:100 stop:549 length:450 start_codon:yes stop_codon:yes gene_type:complete
MKKIFFIILLFSVSCGYSPINKLTNQKYSIVEFEVNGNNQINTILKKNFIKYDKKDLKRQFKLVALNQLEKTTNSKKESGDSSVLSIKIKISLKILENDKNIKELKYLESSSYSSLDNKFELKQYEKILIKSLTDKILSKIHFDLSNIQ